MSTLALEGSESLGEEQRSGPGLTRFLDVALLALALPLFALVGWPMAGYAATAAAWLVARVLGMAAERRAARVLAAGDRRAALGTIAAATLGRVWLVALAVLLVGVLGKREDGLAAAVLALALVTTYLAARFVARVFGAVEGSP